METIINVPDCEEQLSFDNILGDLKAPPMAKHEPSATPSFVEVTKPQAPCPKARCSGKKWGVALALITTVLAGSCLAVKMCSEVQTENVPLAPQHVIEDPLDDLFRMFGGLGVEPAGQDCLACFFGDAGRIRRSVTASTAFVVYKADNTIQSFEVVTHVFNPLPTSAILPISFWTAEDGDEDGQPDAWEPLAPEYRTEGSVMGWERGTFSTSDLAKPFLKIMLDDMDGSWRPQIGNVKLLPSCGEEVDMTGEEGTGVPGDSASKASEEERASEVPQEMAGQLDIFATFDSALAQVLHALGSAMAIDMYGSQPLPFEIDGDAASGMTDVGVLSVEAPPQPEQLPLEGGANDCQEDDDTIDDATDDIGPIPPQNKPVPVLVTQG